MPSIKNKKQNKSSKKGLWQSRKLFWSLFALLLIIGAALVVPLVLDYQKQQAIAADRARFEQAEKDVEKVSQAIIAGVGQPYKVSDNKYCSSPSVKWEEIELTCAVSIGLFYQINDEQFATEITEKLKMVVSKIWNFKQVKMSENLTSNNFTRLPAKENYHPTDSQMILLNFYADEITMECDISNTFYSSERPPFSDYVRGENSSYMLGVFVDCRDDSEEAIFPVKP